MGPRLGINSFNYKNYPSDKGDPNLDSNYYPAKPVISLLQWEHIMEYYLAMSPEQLPAHERKTPIKMGLPLFEVKSPEYIYKAPTISFVKIDESKVPHSIYVSDATYKKIIHFDSKLQIIDSVKIDGPILDMEFQNDSILACNVGVLNPTNGKFGKAEYIRWDANGKMLVDTNKVVDGLSID